MELVFPISLNYTSHLGPFWLVTRELVQNAMDASENWKLSIDGETLTVEDDGDGLFVRDFILGVSRKGEEARGKFGEGLKLAWLTLTKMGLTAEVQSHSLYARNEPAEVMGEPCFKIVWEETGFFPGTHVQIEGWKYPSYMGRFVLPGDPRILFTDRWGRSILEESDPQLYVKGIWMQQGQSYGKQFGFGYDLVDVKIDRDRGIVDLWQASYEIGKLWSSVTERSLLDRFFASVKDRNGERDVTLQKPASPKTFRQAFQAAYGTNAVIATDMGKEAEYRGAKPIEIDYGLREVLKEIVGTDRKYVQQMNGSACVLVPDKQLSEMGQRILKGLRRIAKRICPDTKVGVYVLSDAKGSQSKGHIFLDVSVIDHEEQALTTLIHEMAHEVYDSPDATAEMVESVSRIASKLLAPYIWRA